MQDFRKTVQELAKKLVLNENQRKLFAENLVSIKSKIRVTTDEKSKEYDAFTTKVKDEKLNVNVLGVDGGLLQKECHGIDLIVIRAVGALFKFKDGKVIASDYFPESNPQPIPLVISDPLSNHEFSILSSIERQLKENETACDAVAKFSPDILIMDGSIVPHPSNKPPEDSQIKERYNKLTESYRKLFQMCEKKGTLLAGVVEDSRGSRFSKTLDENLIPKILKNSEIDQKIKKALEETRGILEKTRDTNILHYILKKGERSYIFAYAESPQDHPTVGDMKEWASNIFSFYLKPVEMDRPMRIDFLCKKDLLKTADKISEIVYKLSCFNETYAFPSVLIEADACARLCGEDLEIVYGLLEDSAGKIPSLFELRREIRPF